MWPSTKNMQIVYQIDHLSCQKRKLRLGHPHLEHLIQLLDKYHDHTLNQTKKYVSIELNRIVLIFPYIDYNGRCDKSFIIYPTVETVFRWP